MTMIAITRSTSTTTAPKFPKKSACVVKLEGNDLAFIVNGRPDDPIELRPFDFTFTKERIWKSWCNIGWIPMIRKCFEHPEVRKESSLAALMKKRRTKWKTGKKNTEEQKQDAI